MQHGLFDEDIAVAKKENALLLLCLPKAPDNLERRVGLAGAGGHDQEETVLAFGDGFDGFVDGDALVVARLLAARVVVIVLEDDFFLGWCQPFPGPVFLPEGFR